MNTKIKTNIVGDIAIISGAVCFVLLLFSLFYEIRYVQVGIFALAMLYSEMKMKYRELREKEIDKQLKHM